jgi:DNA repair protein RadC
VDTQIEVHRTLLDALPLQERPAYRLEKADVKALSLMELLAVLVGGPMQLEIAQKLAQKGDLRKVSKDDLLQITGVGKGLSGRILSAVELGRRIAVREAEEAPTISSPAAAAALVQYEMAGLEQEHLRTILLDTRNRLIRVNEVYRGSLNTSLIRTGEVFREAIRANAAGMIVVHNHPSGDPAPSPEDLAMTRNLIEAGRLLDVVVLDHVVIGRSRFISMREQGMGFGEA